MLLLITSTTIIYLCEYSLYFFDNKENYQLIKGLKTKKERYDELKNKEKVVPAFILAHLFENKVVVNDQEKITLGYSSYSKVISCIRNDGWKYYTTDRYGFNNIDKKWDQDEKIFMVGDSYGVGVCVKYKDSLDAQISKFLKKKFTLINLSNTGNGPLLELASFIEYAKEFKPKILIWFYYEGNDLLELRNEKKQKILMNYLNKENFEQNLKNYQSNIDSNIFNYLRQYDLNYKKSSYQSSKIYKFVTLQNVRKKTNIFQVYNERIQNNLDPVFKKIINKVNFIMNKNNGKLYFVYMPLKENFSEEYARSRKEILKFLDSENIKLIDMQKKFASSKLLINDPVNTHYTPEAYKLIAQEVIKSINKDY